MSFNLNKKALVLGLAGTVLMSFATASAEQFASAERTDVALGHYARARALLVEALAEFEQAKEIANPDLMLDSEKWTLTVISKAEDLNRLLDPQPRTTRMGATFRADNRLIGRKAEQTPLPKAMPQTSNLNWEKKDLPPAVMPKAETAPAKDKTKLSNLDLGIVDTSTPETARARMSTPTEEIKAETDTTTEKEAISTDTDTAKSSAVNAPTETVEDEELNKVIEQAIQERLEKMKGEDK